MPSLIAEKTVTARKPHRCLCCGVVAIHPGQRYHRETYVYDGRVYDWVSCADCNEIQGDVYEWHGCPDEGVGADEFDEWAMENRGEDSRAEKYLIRRWGTAHPDDRCESDITLRDEEHRLCRCSLLAGHDGHHDDGEGTTWTACTPDTESEEGR